MWDPTKAVQKNLSDLGLAFDANSVIKSVSTKAGLIERAKRSDGNPWKKIEEENDQKMVIKYSNHSINKHARVSNCTLSGMEWRLSILHMLGRFISAAKVARFFYFFN